jgi:hypothetical protein
VPLIAVAMMGPSVMRSISQAVSIRHKRITFILGAVAAALIFVGSALALIPELGLEGAPIAILIGFSVPSLYMLARSQLGREPIELAYGKLAGATLIAAALASAYHLLDPQSGYLQLGLAAVLFAGYLALLPAIGIVPRQHWAALAQIARAQFGRASVKFDPARALSGLDQAERAALRIAIVKGRPVDQVPERLERRGLAGNGAAGVGADGGAIVVAALRRAAAEGGTPIVEGKKAARRWGSPEQRDANIAAYLFPQGTVAQRDAEMRRLTAEGVRSDELMALESVLEGLASAPREAWKGG